MPLLDSLVQEWKDADFSFVDGGVGGEYEDRLRSAKFCLAPYGHGGWVATFCCC